MNINSPPFLIRPVLNKQRATNAHVTKISNAINRMNSGVFAPQQVFPPVVPAVVTLENITITIDGGGSAIPAGMDLGGATVEIPAACRIVNWTVEADASGSIAVDVLRNNAGVPSASIVGGGNKPTLSSAQYASAAPSGWTSVALAKDDMIGFSISGTPATVKRVTVTLRVQY